MGVTIPPFLFGGAVFVRITKLEHINLMGSDASRSGGQTTERIHQWQIM